MNISLISFLEKHPELLESDDFSWLEEQMNDSLWCKNIDFYLKEWLKEKQHLPILLELLDINGGFILSELEWLGNNASMDFLGTGSNGKAAKKEEEEWWERFENLRNTIQDKLV